MAIVLGIGDAFHLLPRVISHLSPGGFEAHESILSWGKFVTSITMTIFYVLYYHYYRSQSGDKSKNKAATIYLLAALRIAIVLMPQNNWGQIPGDYMFGIYRNIPFLIMGILLIIWSHDKRETPAFKHMDLLIFLSFLFYVPVVLFSEKYPAIGALMMPKTLSYLLIVWTGYKYFIKGFNSKIIFGDSTAFMVMGLIGGVFYREFTKIYSFTSRTHLGKIHVHTLTLGFILILLLYFLTKDRSEDEIKTLKKPFYTYITGLTFTIVNMVTIGIYEVVSVGEEVIIRAAIDGLSGIGHIVLGVGIVWMFVKLYRLIKTDEKVLTARN